MDQLTDLGPYCRKIPKGNDMTTVKHGTAVARPWVRCLVTRDDIFDLGKPIPTTEKGNASNQIICSIDGNTGENGWKERLKWETRLGLSCRILDSMLSPSEWERFLEHAEIRMQRILPVMYALFTFGPIKPLFHYIKNAKGDRDIILVI